MAESAPLTVAHAILLAADACPETFTAADIVIRAYENDRGRFGLEGYADHYPDSNKILACLMGRRGLTDREYLTRVGRRAYQLTPKGKEEVANIRAGVLTRLRGSRPAHLKTIPARELLRCLATRAYTRFAVGRSREITADDALAFWGVDTAYEFGLARRLAQRSRTVGRAIEAADRAGKPIRSGLREVRVSEVQLLSGCHGFLCGRFGGAQA